MSATATCIFFSVDVNGTSLRFLVLHKPDGSWGTALDACMICGWAGYQQDGSNIICRNCASAIYGPSIGQPGGCNPVAVPAQVEGQDLVMDLSALSHSRAQRSEVSLDTPMFLRIVKDSFARQPRRKLLTAVALALATAVATATLSVALDVGDRLAQRVSQPGRESAGDAASRRAAARNRRRRLSSGGLRRVSARGRSRQAQNDFLAQQYHWLRAFAGCAG